MLRFLARLIGSLFIAAGFVGLVIDGARAIANNAVVLTPIGQVAQFLLRERYAGFEGGAKAVHGFLWDPVLVNLLALPAGVVAFLLGALLLWLGQRPSEPIGYLAGP